MLTIIINRTSENMRQKGNRFSMLAENFCRSPRVTETHNQPSRVGRQNSTIHQLTLDDLYVLFPPSLIQCHASEALVEQWPI